MNPPPDETPSHEASPMAPLLVKCKQHRRRAEIYAAICRTLQPMAAVVCHWAMRVGCVLIPVCLLEPIPERSRRLLKGDQGARELEQGQVVGPDPLPSYEESAEAVQPTSSSFDHPTTGFSAHAPEQRLFATSPDMRSNTSFSDRRFSVGIIVTLVETEMFGPTWDHAGREAQSRRVRRPPSTCRERWRR